MTPKYKAGTDWREEGRFRPEQYAEGSKEQQEYIAEMHRIIRQTREASEAT